ncbi:hypothetical protein [Microbacterium sp. BK668]|uniref:hypothetical protein n=1 Tax=Microbacterium sp. BK668 TaxID=2512118 RepID=UPI00105C1E75|nr:hypothetical protein [Microbacterium sp. BK668]
MAVAVSIEPAALAAVPGEPVEAVVTVRNDSQIVEQYALQAMGPGGEFTTLVPDHVSVYPERTETVTVRVTVPRSPAVPAGRLDVAIRVVPTSAAPTEDEPLVDRTTVAEVVELAVTVEPFTAVAAELVPRVSRSRGRKRVRLAVDNNGNDAIAVSLLSAGTERLSVVPRDPDLLIDAGHAQFVRVTLVPRRRIWRGQAASHPYSITVTPSSGEPVVADGTHMQEPVFPPWFWKALLALAALIALLILLWNLLLKPTVEQTARDAVAEPLASAQQQAAEAEEAAAGAQQTAQEAKDAAQSGSGEPPPPPPPASTTVDSAIAVTLTDQPGGAVATRDIGPAVPDGAVFQITDLVFNNPQGDVATVQLAYDDTVLLNLSAENYRDLDLHFVTPIQIPAGQTLEVRMNCVQVGKPVGRTPDRCLATVLVTGATVTQPAG